MLRTESSVLVTRNCFVGGVAQLGERVLCKHEVRGSTPLTSKIGEVGSPPEVRRARLECGGDPDHLQIVSGRSLPENTDLSPVTLVHEDQRTLFVVVDL